MHLKQQQVYADVRLEVQGCLYLQVILLMIYRIQIGWKTIEVTCGKVIE